MSIFCGKEGIITEIIKNNRSFDDYEAYYLDISKDDWYWVPFMFDDIMEIRKKKLKKLEKI